MLKKALLALIALLLVGGGVFMYFANTADPHLPPAGATTADGEASSEAPRQTAAADGQAAANADAAPSEASERAVAAVFDGSGQRPLPDNATWVTVRVVEKATGSPLAGAVVRWSDETSWRWLEEQPNGERPENLQFLGERLAELAGWHTRSDAQGYARVTLRESTMVHAQHGELYGRLSLDGDTIAPVGGHLVELVPDANLHVRVLDANGAPAANVPISVAVVDKNDRPIGWFGWMAMVRTRAPDGLATLPHLQTHFSEFRSEMDKESRGWRVRIHLPGLKDPGVAFDAASPPKEPIELRLPPCGSMRVRATFAGKPLAGFRSAWIGIDSDSKERMFRANHQERVGPDGVARFPWVILGATINVGSDVAGGLQAKETGPQQPGQEVEVVLRPADDSMLIAGRLLLPDRTAAAGISVNVSAQGPQLRNNTRVQTDLEGRFLANLGSPRKDNKVDKLSFSVREKGQPARNAETSARTLRSGVEELGDIVLADDTLLVAGRIVADGKPFTDPIEVFVEREEIREGSAPRWRGLESQITQVEKDTFTVRGQPGKNRLRLGARSRRVLPVTPIEFQAGATDVVLTVECGPGLAATVLLPDKCPVEHLSAVLVPSTGEAKPADERSEDRGKTQPEQPRDGRANLRWPAVRAGTYRLELRLWTVAAPLLTIPDVVLPLPAAGDPRLVDIDLRPFVRTVTLDLVDAEGKRPSGEEGAVFPAAQANPAEWLGFGIWSTPVVLALPPGPYDLLVCARSYRPQPVRGDAAQVSVRLDAWPKLVVRVPDVPQLPERARLRVSLQATESTTGRYRTPWNTGDRGQFFNAPTSGVAVVDGKAAVPIGDGLFHLKLTLSDNRRPYTLAGCEPKQVLSTAGEITVTVPKEQWEKGIEFLKQPPKPGENTPPIPPPGFPWGNR